MGDEKLPRLGSEPGYFYSKYHAATITLRSHIYPRAKEKNIKLASKGLQIGT